jgi:TPP-dependent 2-oxoacid decarboxylase
MQVFAGNIGWAPAAGLGYSLASQASGKRLVVVCGDGGFQMTASELGNYAKFGSNAIMILVNNDGYLIERYVSPIPHSNYNYTKRWNHTLLAEAMCNGEGKYKILKVREGGRNGCQGGQGRLLTLSLLWVRQPVRRALSNSQPPEPCSSTM